MTRLILGFALIGAVLLAPGCKANRFEGATVTELRVSERKPGSTPRTISDPAILRELMGMLARASVAEDSTKEVQEKLWAGWNLDVTGEKNVQGRWSFDPENSRIARLDIWSGRYVYTIQPADRARLAALLR